MATKADTIERLRNLYEKAVQERTGVSFLLSTEEAELIDPDTILQIEVETGYRRMCSGTNEFR
jgi:hypothetical protein